MTYYNLKEVFENNLFTDLTLVLCDNCDKIVVRVHKIILYSSCDYFKKLLTNCREKTANEITIQVINASIMRDIILSFYGIKNNDKKNCKYHLQKIICLDFLGINCELNFFEKNNVLAENFDLLLDVMDIIGYNTRTIAIIAKNIPDNYDLKLLPKELLQAILNQETSLLIANTAYHHSVIRLWNYNITTAKRKYDGRLNIEPEKEFRYNSKLYCHIKFLSNGEKMAHIFSDGSIKIYDISTGNIVEKKLDNVYYWYSKPSSKESLLDKSAKILFSSNEKYIVSYHTYAYTVFGIWNLKSEKCIAIIGEDDWYISGLHISSDNKHVVSYHKSGDVYRWNIKNGTLVNKENVFKEPIYSIVVSPDFKKLFVKQYPTTAVLDSNDQKILKILETLPENISFSSDCQKIAFYNGEKISVYDTTDYKELYHIPRENNYSIKHILFSSDNLKLIITSGSSIYIYDANTGKLFDEITAGSGSIKSMDVSCYCSSLGKKIKNILESSS